MVISTHRDIVMIAFDQSFGVECGDVLHRAVVEALSTGHQSIVVNLLDVSRIDAAGLGELVRALTTVRAHGGDLKLVVRCGTVRELLERTNLTAVLPVYASPDDAAASFAATCAV